MNTQEFDVEVITHGKKASGKFVEFQCELAVRELYKDSIDFRDAIAVSEQSGFTLSAFAPNNVGFSPKLVEIDYIMVRNDLVDFDRRNISA